MTPVALCRNGIPGLAVHTLDQYPRDGLGIYSDLETSSQFSGYKWSDWTTKTLQPMHIDEALRAMIDQPARSGASTSKNFGQKNFGLNFCSLNGSVPLALKHGTDGVLSQLP